MNEEHNPSGKNPYVEMPPESYVFNSRNANGTSDSDVESKLLAKNRLALDLLKEFQDRPEILRAVKESEIETAKIEQTVSKVGDNVLPNIQKLGRFTIQREIGRGGNGIVVLATDPELKRDVAIKIPRFETVLSGEAKERFMREAKAAASLGHPGLVAVYELGFDQGLYFIVNQFVDGENLSDWLSENAVSPTQCAEAVSELTDAIQHAHCKGVLHRDLKPSNIIVELGRGEVPIAKKFKITDFGLATIGEHDSELTRSGSLVGTPTYMSPEQANGSRSKIGPQTDVYGLGVILYQMLTGQPPFQADDLLEIISKVRKTDPVAPSKINVFVPIDLNAICMKCLEKQPEQRYESALMLQKDLQRFLNGEPVIARPVSTPAKMIRTAKRYPLISGMVATVGCLLLLIAGVASGSAFLLSKSHQDVLDHLEREIAAKDAATKNEELAIRSLYEAKLATADALISSRIRGQRNESLEHIRSASKHLDRLKLGDAEKERLRTAIVRCANLVDLEIEKELPIDTHERLSVAHHPGSDYYAFTNETGTTVSVRNHSDERFKLDLEARKSFYLKPYLKFSRNSNHLAMHHKVNGGGGMEVELAVWNLQTRQRTTFIPLRTDRPSVDFNRSGNAMVFIANNRTIAWVDTSTMKIKAEYSPEKTPMVLSFSNKSDMLAWQEGDSIKVAKPIFVDEILKLEVVASFESRVKINQLTFSPEDSVIAGAGEDGHAYLWNILENKLDLMLNTRGGRLSQIEFHPTKPIVATSGYDRVGRLWHSETGELLLKSEDFPIEKFSSDGSFVESSKRILKFRADDSYVRMEITKPHIQKTSSEVINIHPNGQLACVNWSGRLEFFDLVSGRNLGGADTVSTHYRFANDGNSLLAGSKNGLFHLPIETQNNDNQVQVKIGPEERLSEQSWFGYVSADANTKTIFIARRYPIEERTTLMFDTESKVSTKLDRYPRNARWSDVSFDGRLLAIGTWHGQNVEVREIESGKMVKVIEGKNAQVKFSPDGKLLAMDFHMRIEVRRTDSWAKQFPDIVTQSAAPGPLAFTPDNKFLALSRTVKSVELVRVSDGVSMVTFELPDNDLVASLAFTPSGDKIVVGSASGKIHCWDLRQLQTMFKHHGLESDLVGASNHMHSVTEIYVELNLKEIGALPKQ